MREVVVDVVRARAPQLLLEEVYLAPLVRVRQHAERHLGRQREGVARMPRHNGLAHGPLVACSWYIHAVSK